MYNYSILGSTLCSVMDGGCWIWSYALTIFGLMFAVRFLTLPIVRLVRDCFHSPTSYSVNFPKWAREPLTDAERAQLASLFMWADRNGNKHLTPDHVQKILHGFDESISMKDTLGLMTIVDDLNIHELTLFEFYELCERTSVHRPGPPPPPLVLTRACCPARRRKAPPQIGFHVRIVFLDHVRNTLLISPPALPPSRQCVSRLFEVLLECQSDLEGDDHRRFMT